MWVFKGVFFIWTINGSRCRLGRTSGGTIFKDFIMLVLDRRVGMGEYLFLQHCCGGDLTLGFFAVSNDRQGIRRLDEGERSMR